MNAKDTHSALEQIRAYIIVDKDKNGGESSPVIAFDFDEIVFNLKNSSRKISAVLDHLNEIMSARKFCEELGGIYTLCHYEHSTIFLIKADKVVSYTDFFVPEEKIIDKAVGYVTHS